MTNQSWPLADSDGLPPHFRTNHGTSVSLRLTGVTGTGHFEGDTPWSPLAHEFDQSEDGPVEFILELRAHTGEAWFDLDSLVVEVR